MKDNFGNPLSIGDEVYFASNRGCGSCYIIAKGTVIDFMNGKLKIQPLDNETWCRSKPILLNHRKVGKIFKLNTNEENEL